MGSCIVIGPLVVLTLVEPTGAGAPIAWVAVGMVFRPAKGEKGTFLEWFGMKFRVYVRGISERLRLMNKGNEIDTVPNQKRTIIF